MRAPSLRSLAFELAGRLPGASRGWPRTIARNSWFQRWACQRLKRMADPPQALFAYSYAALSLLQLARQRGLRTVLGQIDVGELDEQLVAEEHRRYPQFASGWRPAPPAYWQAWHQELELADRIVVNSSWSLRCLRQQGVSQSKLRLIPLVYEPSGLSTQPPLAISSRSDSPFQLLFLGTIGLRKGIGRLLVAMRMLEGKPVCLTLAGPTELDPTAWRDRRNIRWLGAVPRSEVGSLYKGADAMILPTITDGFALTQLEALAHGCPVIASLHCGAVVAPGINGWLLDDLEPDTIATTILAAAETAADLRRPLAMPAFGIQNLGAAISELPANSTQPVATPRID